MKTLEVCTGSYQDCLDAYLMGAKRVELNSALSLGGLTPSLATLQMVKENTDLIVICMVRPRAAGFCYTNEEYEVMKREAHILLQNGADGLAFGFLTEDFEIDEKKTKEFVEIVHSYNKTAVFHRAFEMTKNGDESIQLLIKCGVDRILTSGQRKDAYEGLSFLKEWNEKYGTQIEILPGCGINPSNVEEILTQTKVSQVHSSCKGYRFDKTTKNEYVDFSYMGESKTQAYESVDKDIVKKMLETITNIGE